MGRSMAESIVLRCYSTDLRQWKDCIIMREKERERVESVLAYFCYQISLKKKVKHQPVHSINRSGLPVKEYWQVKLVYL